MPKASKPSVKHSPNFKLFARSVLRRKQVTYTYGDHFREACVHIVGHKKAKEKAQVFQFGGGSTKGLPPGGEYRCIDLDKVVNPKLRDGPWFGPEKHKQRQRCIDHIYVHIDLSVENQPGRQTARRKRSRVSTTGRGPKRTRR